MSKLKICVYAICKNESKFIKRWYHSMKEADQIYVVDTGSTDDSIEVFKKLGVHVKKEIVNPWRFDVARNISLDMVPKDTDICVCTDLDEIFLPGWRNKLEKLWKDNNINRLGYNYNWSLDKDNRPIVNFYINKIHSRNDYRWLHPVHEVLVNINNNEKMINTDEITLNHYPDNQKPRSSYLPLLELSVKEDPTDDRNMHYLGREYMYYGKWNEAIDTLIKHLALPKATWKDERCASMRFIARSYTNLNRYEEARMWLKKAILEAPYLRDPYIELALLEYKFENWDEIVKYCNKALEIKTHAKSYINEPFSWNYTVYDLLSLGYYYQGKMDKAKEMIDIAIAMNPEDERLLNNRAIIEKSIKK